LRRRANIATAEHAFALLLALAKRLNEIDGLVSMEALTAAGFSPRPFDLRYTSSSNWARIPGLRTLHNTTMGIVGLGEIGREFALRAAAFGMRILYHQRTRLPESVEGEFGASYRPLNDLLAESDSVCLLVPSNVETRHLIGAAEIARMKHGACLVNVSRAEIVERNALLEALQSGQLGSYGLDTFYEEPARPDDPLFGLHNVIVTPRTAAQPRMNALGDLEEVILNLSLALGDGA
jgi:lactate dehydrogenase-like 2-hydroxyacid dehydrogenase